MAAIGSVSKRGEEKRRESPVGDGELDTTAEQWFVLNLTEEGMRGCKYNQ